jgi:hypothetical protein
MPSYARHPPSNWSPLRRGRFNFRELETNARTIIFWTISPSSPAQLGIVRPRRGVAAALWQVPARRSCGGSGRLTTRLRTDSVGLPTEERKCGGGRWLCMPRYFFHLPRSNALFMDGSLACAARFSASAALCRYLSARSDIQGEHRTDDAVPQNDNTFFE